MIVVLGVLNNNWDYWQGGGRVYIAERCNKIARQKLPAAPPVSLKESYPPLLQFSSRSCSVQMSGEEETDSTRSSDSGSIIGSFVDDEAVQTVRARTPTDLEGELKELDPLSQVPSLSLQVCIIFKWCHSLRTSNFALILGTLFSSTEKSYSR